MNAVLIGNTGSGKSTLGRALSEAMRLPLISSGSIARQMSDDDPATGLALQQGAMAPEAAMRVAIRQAIEHAEVQHGGWILDGFPRIPAQLIALMTWTAALPAFVLVDLPEWTCIERLVARARTDDNPDSIARKLDSFASGTSAMVSILERGGVLTTVNGELETAHQVDYLCAGWGR